MKNVNDLVNIIKTNDSNYVIKAITPDKEVVDVGMQQYIEDEIYYMFKREDDEKIHTLNGLKLNLEYEASDNCWKSDGCGIFYDGNSNLLGCDIRFENYYVDDAYDEEVDYEINRITVDEENGIVYLHCEDFEDYTTSTEKYMYEITDEERTLIKQALDFYGDYIADRVGYSSGEKYWDLMNKF